MLKILFYLGNVNKTDLSYKLSLELAKYMLDFYNVYIEIAIDNPNEKILSLDNDIFINNLNGDNLFNSVQRLNNLIEKKKFNIVYSHFYQSNLILALAKLLSEREDIVYIGSFHRTDLYEKFNHIYKYPIRYLYKHLFSVLDGIVVDSYIVKEEIEKLFFINPEKIEIIHNFINISEVRRKALDRLDEFEKSIFEKKVILNVSTLRKEKRHAQLIKAFKIVAEKRINVNLVIVGEGEDREYLEELRGVDSSIYLLSYKENSYKYMIHSEIYVSTSVNEVFSRSILEAQAFGLPVIAFKNKGSIMEYLDDSALFVKDGDIKGLANAMLELLNNDTLREKYKNKSLNNVKRFSIEKIADRYYSYFNEKLKEKKLEKILNPS